tara:strand:- start:199 stop:549 length:351 start_codon:yes stop_codon:yes gene_type:complete
MNKAQELQKVLSEGKFFPFKAMRKMDIWARKATSFAALGSVGPSDLPPDEFKKLDTFQDKAIYGRPLTASDSPAATDFVQGGDLLPMVFILLTRFGKVLINTEGYDYARYAVMLEE